MIRYTGTVTIDRPVVEVFGFVADFENVTKWQKGVIRSEKVTPGPLGRGSRFTEQVRMMAWKFDTVCEITRFEPSRRMDFMTTSSGPITYNGSFTFEPQGDTTRITLEAEMRTNGAWRLLEPLFSGEVKRETDAELQQLKSVVEEAASQPAGR